MKISFALSGLVTGLVLLLAGRAPAQTITNLYSFTGGNDGAWPQAAVVLSNNTLYGTTTQGGSSMAGTLFTIHTDGSGFQTIYMFGAANDGANPSSALVLSGGTLYGTARFAGANGFGTVFAVSTNGTGFNTLYSFAGGSDGSHPFAGLTLSGATLYGTTIDGNILNDGALFAVGTNGTGYNAVYLFNGASDGATPYAGVIVSGTTLYGTAKQGGDAGSGTVYKLNTDGTGFVTLHSFTDLADGGVPYGRLVLSGSTLYGTTSEGGTANLGTVFSVSTSGAGFTTLHSFAGGNDGATPWAGLVLVGNKLYGTTYGGGTTGNGTVFVINTDGTGYTNVHSFSSTPDGAHPYGELVASGNKLYGTTFYGGTFGFGTVFCLSPGAPRLTINHLQTKVVLTWPTNFTGFTLQSTTNLVPPSWSTVSPAPVVVNGLNTVTNSTTGTRKFYRLIQ